MEYITTPMIVWTLELTLKDPLLNNNPACTDLMGEIPLLNHSLLMFHFKIANEMCYSENNTVVTSNKRQPTIFPVHFFYFALLTILKKKTDTEN